MSLVRRDLGGSGRMDRDRREQGHSWLDGKVAPATSVTTFCANLEMLLAEVWNPWPPFLPSVPHRTPGHPWPGAAVEGDALGVLFEFLSQSIL